MHEVNVLDILVLEPGAFYVMDRGYLDFARLFQMHQAGAFFVTSAKSNMNARRVYSAKVDKEQRHHLRYSHCVERTLCSPRLPRALTAYPVQRPPDSKDVDLLDQQHGLAALNHCSFVQESLAGRVVLQMDQTAPSHQEVSGQQRERSKDANLVCRIHLCAHCHHQKGTSIERLSLHFATDLVGLDIRQN